MLLPAALGCSGGDLTLPQAGTEIRLSVAGGDQQTGTVGEELPKPLTVELRDAQGRVVVGRTVAFVVTGGPASAALTPDTAITDGDGQALGRWVLGTTPGEYSAEARVLAQPNDPPDRELPVVRFTASAHVGAPDTLRAESATSQSGRAGEPVAQVPVVRLLDRYGNPVAGVTVTWTVTSGGGTVSAPTVPTDADGRASVTWTLGERIGIHRLTASVDGVPNGSPVVFSAVVFF